MYHCNTYFYLMNGQDGLFEKLEEVTPLPHFTHKFIKSAAPESGPAAQADVIIADLCGFDEAEVLQSLLAWKKKDGQLILLADAEQSGRLMEQNLAEVTDIWTKPLTEKELLFRFAKWQCTYKESKDYWQNRNYFETMINSVPHLIWFKDKEGAHMKVNDYFCKAVNKTMEQIEGRGHYYIWDIDPEEYARGEFICMESEYEVMEKRETCVFDETVKIGDSMRELKQCH